MIKKVSIIALAVFVFSSCDSNLRDISGSIDTPTIKEVIPIDIEQEGFDFLEKMQGHWVGTNRVIADDYLWFGWDYRAISKSHIHGIHEGGSMGNLLTSFFVTNYKNKRTIMARNGGLLNGIYRTSYFVLDQIETIAANNKKYRFVDAIGSKDIMYFELRFKNDSLYYNAYTSGLGARVPARHMTFKGRKEHVSLSKNAADATGFPTNDVEKDFAEGFRQDYLYVEPGASKPASATFLAQSDTNDVYTLSGESGDPFTIIDHPRLGSIQININRNMSIKESNLFVYLSKEPLTDANGLLTSNPSAYNSLLHFPTLEQKENDFLFTYIHPGSYYLTVIADQDKNKNISSGDISSVSKSIILGIKEHKSITISDIEHQN